MLSSCAVQHTQQADTDYAAWVNPFIGTDFTGNTYPGAQAPFGMVQLSPDNGTGGWNRISGYYYPDSTIAGFSHTHLSGTGAGDLYDISFLPVTLPCKEAEGELGIYSRFDHADESASAGYYHVRLKDYDIHVELTATPRCGVQRYTFPGSDATVLLNLKKAMNWDATNDSHIRVVDSCTIEGYRHSDGWARDQHLYFRTRFSQPIATAVIDSVTLTKDGKPAGAAYTATFSFKLKEDHKLVVVTALSGTSQEGAARNLQAEAPDTDFDNYLKQTKAAWNKELGKIEVKTAEPQDKDQLAIFYTAMYHAMIAPTIFSDVDGAYRGADKKIHHTGGWTDYSTFSLWDTYRAAHPLYTYLTPERDNDMVKSFLAFYEQHGRLPLWPLYGAETEMMLGYHAVPVIADAYLKGIGDFDAEKALQACVASADMDSYRGLDLYKKYGYIPYDLKQDNGAENWSLSKTLEYAYDDYCIARMAEKMGRKEIAERFYKRSQNYKNLFNPATGFMQPRDSKGNFIKDFNPDDYTPYITESNAWHYLWSVQQDIPGLISLMGGKQKFEAMLDSMFTHHPDADEKLPIFSTGMIGQYAHGNEPSHHVTYLYDYTDSPWKTQKYVAQVMHDLYQNKPGGICGNEDCGQMSAWYVFSAMGFYPVDPVSGRYEIGTPLFPELKLHLSNGKTFTVLAPKASKENIYIQSVKVDGKPWNSTWITHEQIMSGATVEFEMGNEKSSWGTTGKQQ